MVPFSFDDEFIGLIFFSKDTKVEIKPNAEYLGKALDCAKVCGVSILRAGETMEQALCDVVSNVPIGKILIQTNEETNEPEVQFQTSFWKPSLISRFSSTIFGCPKTSKSTRSF